MQALGKRRLYQVFLSMVLTAQVVPNLRRIVQLDQEWRVA